MNETITIDGQEYEVLTLGKQDGMTHVLFAGGELKIGETCAGLSHGFYAYDSAQKNGGICYRMKEAKLHNIQPLKLIERVPVSFVAWTAIVNFHGNDVVAIICPETVHIDTKFQCVAVNK